MSPGFSIGPACHKRSFVDRSGLASPIHLMGPPMSVMRGLAMSRNRCPEPMYRELVVLGVCGTVRAAHLLGYAL